MVRNIEGLGDLRLLLEQGGLVVRRLDGTDEMRGIAGAAVGDGGHIVRQLQEGELVVRLTDGGGDDVTGVPGAPGRFPLFGARHVAGGLRDLDSGLLTEAEFGSPFVDLLDAQFPTGLVEETVTGNIDGVRDVVGAVGGVVGTVESVVGIVGVGAGAVPDALVGDGALFQSRNGRTGLEGGTGLIGTHDGAVPKGCRLVLGPFRILFLPLVVVVRGVGGTGEDLSRVDIFDYDGSGTLPGSGNVQGVHALFQGVLGHFLQFLVEGQDNGVALLRVHRIGVRGVAFIVDGDGLRSPLAPKVVLHGKL